MRKTGEDLELFGECFARNATARSADRMHWQYAANPTGQIFVDFAVASTGRVAAIYASQPARFQIETAVALGLQSVDTITDKDFRGRGLFLELAKRTYERAAESGAKLVYGFPNGSSAHGFFERLGWTNLDPIPFLIRPLRLGYVARQLEKKLGRIAASVPNLPLYVARSRKVKRGRIEEITTFDDRATQLWREFSRGVRVAVDRNADYLNWRLVAKPQEYYRAHAVFDGDRMRALVAHVAKDKHGGNVGYIMESLCAPGWEPELRVLLANAVTSLAKEGADVVLAWCFEHTPTYSSFLRSAFVPFPERFRPIELHFGARGFDATAAGIVKDRRNWYLSYLDSDTT